MLPYPDKLRLKQTIGMKNIQNSFREQNTVGFGFELWYLDEMKKHIAPGRLVFLEFETRKRGN